MKKSLIPYVAALLIIFVVGIKKIPANIFEITWWGFFIGLSILIIHEIVYLKNQGKLKNKIEELERSINAERKAKNEIEIKYSEAKNAWRIFSENVIHSLDFVYEIKSPEDMIVFIFNQIQKFLNSYKGIINIYNGFEWKIIFLDNNNVVKKESVMMSMKKSIPEDKIVFSKLYNFDFLPLEIQYILKKFFILNSELLYLPIFNQNDFHVSIIVEANSDHVMKFLSSNHLEIFLNIFSKFFKISHDYNESIALNQSILEILIHFLESTYVKKNYKKIASLSLEISDYMNLPSEIKKKIYISSMLIDIGYVNIPSEIINKNGKLTKEEFEIIKKHPIFSYKIISEYSNLKEIATIVKYHHEFWNGNGYPEGLKETEIPLESRIIAIADAFISMLSDRPFRKALSVEEAVNEIITNAGVQFDPGIAAILVKIISKKFPKSIVNKTSIISVL